MSQIFGGRVAAKGAWPWQVSIQSMSTHFCSGTILNHVWVLSATHCFISNPGIKRVHIHVVAGIDVLSAPGVHAQIRSILKVKLHERYNNVRHNNDVALVLLSSPFHFSDHVQPAWVPHNLTHELALDFSHCFISGWGRTSYIGSGSNRLQEAEVKLIDRRTCNQTTWYRGLITDNMLCAGLESGEADSCQVLIPSTLISRVIKSAQAAGYIAIQHGRRSRLLQGDSGGPLQCYSEDEERFYVVGVTSFGEKCGIRRRPGVYTRTSRFSDWLKTGQVAAAAAPRLNTRPISALLGSSLMLLWNILTDCGTNH
ncbi:acrosin isoform X3 [Scophthalmus maximus]|nr:acrosin isoform X3 [Scophthalmus maximus]XP_035500587.1 acrosin isoform X3 [Scophthalmus maximus]